MEPTPLQPPGWAAPRGYANGMLVPAGARLCFVAGQIAWDAQQRLVGEGDLALQFRAALANVLAVVAEAGGEARHLVSMTVYVIDKQAYLAAARAIGAHWRELCGKHYPAMALVEVADLLEEGALVEIQAVAALPGG
ncbi:MAG TPA: RidA family protein [Planctomycetota bacterium]|nr:RidA family protein [Planctomycetota bacterium]